MMKRLKWSKPELVELGSARRMSFGEAGTEGTLSLCHVGTGASQCDVGHAPGEQ